MYQKYQTDVLVLGSREQGEADRTYTLYTRDFGLVRARASAVRSENSKMRYALQNHSRANVSLVKGKRGWRIAGARAGEGIPATADARGVSALARVSELVQRLVQGEGHNEYLFETLIEAHNAFLKGGEVPTMEIMCVARVLYALGYISAEALQTAIFTHTGYTLEHVHEAEGLKEKLLFSINRAISETHL